LGVIISSGVMRRDSSGWVSAIIRTGGAFTVTLNGRTHIRLNGSIQWNPRQKGSSMFGL